MTTTARRLDEFKASSGRYVPKRAYSQSPERVALIKKQGDAVQTARKSRDEWKARAMRGRTVAVTLSELAERLDSNVLRFVAAEIEEALR